MGATANLTAGVVLIVIGLGLIIFSSWGGGINAGNLVVGAFLGIIGVGVAFSGKKENSADNVEKVTQSSTEKKAIDGNHVTIKGEVITRTITDSVRGKGRPVV